MKYNPHEHRNFFLELRIFTVITKEAWLWAYAYLKENPYTIVRNCPKTELGRIRAYLKQTVEEHGLIGLNKLVKKMPQEKYRKEAEEFLKKYLD